MSGRRLSKVGVLVLSCVVLVPVVGLWRFQRATTDLVEQLQRPGARSEDELVLDRSSIPPVVARFFERALPRDARRIQKVVAVQEGEFRLGEAEDSWRPFRATEYFFTDPPGFVWDASIRMLPFVPIRVRDAYVNGSGSMHGAVVGLFPVVNERAKPELDLGALQRYLAEAVWFPTALLPGPDLRWEAIDDARARATLTDGALSVAAEFRFDDDGDVVEIIIADRYREIDGRYEPSPWAVSCSGHEAREGFRIPAACVVEWRVDGTPMPYWRGRVVDIRFTF